MAEKNTADIGFEKQIWNAACVLRGNMDASEYKGVVLGLIFLKYISDRFEDKYNQLVADGDGFEEDRDEYTSEGIFFVPAGARWSDVSAKAHDPEIGQVIDDAMRAIEKENARLKDILPKNFARPELDKRRLGEVVDLFTNIKMIEHGSEKDILGRTYEYCLSMFAEQEGKRGGEFFTPSCVVRTLVEVLQPFKGRVYDPCCGSGGMFVQSAKFVENHSGNINDISIYGQDSNPTTWKLAQMNLAIRGIARTHTPKAINEKWLKFGDLLINSTGDGTLGRVAQVWFAPKALTVDSHVTIVRPAREELIFYIGLWGILHEKEIESLHTGSTGQTELPRDRVKMLKLLLPDDSSLSRFNSIIAPMTSTIISNQEENQKLANLRDTLLPKLMSGVIDVANVQL